MLDREVRNSFHLPHPTYLGAILVGLCWTLTCIKCRVHPSSLGELGHLPTFMQGKVTPELISVNNIVVLLVGLCWTPTGIKLCPRCLTLPALSHSARAVSLCPRCLTLPALSHSPFGYYKFNSYSNVMFIAFITSPSATLSKTGSCLLFRLSSYLFLSLKIVTVEAVIKSQ